MSGKTSFVQGHIQRREMGIQCWKNRFGAIMTRKFYPGVTDEPEEDYMWGSVTLTAGEKETQEAQSLGREISQ